MLRGESGEPVDGESRDHDSDVAESTSAPGSFPVLGTELSLPRGGETALFLGVATLSPFRYIVWRRGVGISEIYGPFIRGGLA